MSLEKGDLIPEFELKDQNGTVFKSSSTKGKPVVIFFYPKNFTPGCIAEVCSFRDRYEDFLELGVNVIGISADSERSHKRFATRYKLPYILLADTHKKVRRLFGVKNNLLGLLPGRETFIFDEEGKLTLQFNAFNAEPHIKKSLAYFQK